MYTDTTAAEQAYSDLTKLKMEGEEIDKYVAQFEQLLLRAGWEHRAKGSLKMFKKGLCNHIHYTMLQ